MKGIQIHQLVKRFGNKQVLDGCQLDIQAQESVVLLGQSGSGKSVLAKCVLGLMPFQGGSVTIGDVDICTETPQQQEQRFAQSGVVFQSYALFDSLTVWENVAFGLQGTDDQRRRRAIETLDQVSLSPDTADLFPSDISGGMKRRVSIARAIIQCPTYLFFDEPTEGLDPVLSMTISDLIRQVITDLKATALTITHNMHNARVIADKVALLDQGKIIWCGPTQTMSQADCPLLQAFLKAQGLSHRT